MASAFLVLMVVLHLFVDVHAGSNYRITKTLTRKVARGKTQYYCVYNGMEFAPGARFLALKNCEKCICTKKQMTCTKVGFAKTQLGFKWDSLGCTYEKGVNCKAEHVLTHDRNKKCNLGKVIRLWKK